MKGKPISYSETERAWIKARAHLPRKLLHAVFVYVFDRPDVSQANIASLCKRNGWTTGRTGRIEPGQTPWNKGKAMPSHPNSKRTQFQPGSRSGRAQALYKPIGTERLSKDGYLERKIHDGLPLQSRWRAVHLIRWEEAHGPVPDGHCLKCLDGDKRNTDPANWIAIPRALLPRLSGRWRMSYDNAPADLKPVLLNIARLEHAARQARKDRTR